MLTLDGASAVTCGSRRARAKFTGINFPARGYHGVGGKGSGVRLFLAIPGAAAFLFAFFEVTSRRGPAPWARIPTAVAVASAASGRKVAVTSSLLQTLGRMARMAGYSVARPPARPNPNGWPSLPEILSQLQSTRFSSRNS
jgi:hypothetical protein